MGARRNVARRTCHIRPSGNIWHQPPRAALEQKSLKVGWFMLPRRTAHLRSRFYFGTHRRRETLLPAALALDRDRCPWRHNRPAYCRHTSHAPWIGSDSQRADRCAAYTVQARRPAAMPPCCPASRFEAHSAWQTQGATVQRVGCITCEYARWAGHARRRRRAARARKSTRDQLLQVLCARNGGVSQNLFDRGREVFEYI
jgi:hypothetical protein